MTVETTNEIQSHKQRIATARAARNDVDLRNALLDAFAEFGSLATNFLSARNYAAAESTLKEWGETLERAKAELLEKQLLFNHSRLQAAMGSFEEIKGLEAYFLYGDFVDAPRILEKAEIHHERAAEFASKVPFPADAPPQARAMQDGIVAMQRAEMQRVRGMRFLIQGEFESEAGGLDRAVTLLDQSVETLRAAEAGPSSGLPSDDAVAAVLEKGQRELNFIDFAQALLHKTRSDAALLAGDFTKAAAEQQARAEALKRCQTMHVRAGQPLNEGFARRLARDAHVANQRHDRLVAEASKRPQWEWLKAVAFFIMAIGSALLFMWLAKGDLLNSPAMFGLVLFFVMAIAGVGARLVEWKEAANWFHRSATQSSTPAKS
jgi:hypothetical protein